MSKKKMDNSPNCVTLPFSVCNFLVVSNASGSNSSNVSAFEGMNINSIETAGWSLQGGLSYMLKKERWKDKAYFWLGALMYVANSGESIDYTVKEQYFGDKRYALRREKMTSLGVSFSAEFNFKIYKRIYGGIELNQNIGTNPRRQDDIPIFHLQGLGYIIKPQPTIFLQGTSGGLKLFYTIP